MAKSHLLQIYEVINSCKNCKTRHLSHMIIKMLQIQKFIRNGNPIPFSLLLNRYLTGNPCCDFKGYRDYVVAVLPQIMFLDGVPIVQTERIKARQSLPKIRDTMHELEAKHFRKEN